MGIYIKNMNKPKRCNECPLYDGMYKYCPIRKREVILDKIAYECPLIEIKPPHGRLIDVNIIKQKFFPSEIFSSRIIVENDIDITPTVIEAEVE